MLETRASRILVQIFNNFFPRGNLDSLGKNDPENRKNNDLTNFPAENQRVFTFRTLPKLARNTRIKNFGRKSQNHVFPRGIWSF